VALLWPSSTETTGHTLEPILMVGFGPKLEPVTVTITLPTVGPVEGEMADNNGAEYEKGVEKTLLVIPYSVTVMNLLIPWPGGIVHNSLPVLS